MCLTTIALYKFYLLTFVLQEFSHLVMLGPVKEEPKSPEVPSTSEPVPPVGTGGEGAPGDQPSTEIKEEVGVAPTPTGSVSAQFIIFLGISPVHSTVHHAG